MVLTIRIGDKERSFRTVERFLYPATVGLSAGVDAFGFWNGGIIGDDLTNSIPLSMSDLAKLDHPVIIEGEGDSGKSVFLVDFKTYVQSSANVLLVRLRDYSGERLVNLSVDIEDFLKNFDEKEKATFILVDGLDENVAAISHLAQEIDNHKSIGDRLHWVITTRPFGLQEFVARVKARCYHMTPLSMDDATKIATELCVDWSEFYKIALAKLILSICPRPELLVQLLRLHALGRLGSRTADQIFHSLAIDLCREHRDGVMERQIVMDDEYTDDDVLDAISWIAGVLEIQGKKAIDTNSDGEFEGSIKVAELVTNDYPRELLEKVLQGRLFEPLQSGVFRFGVNDLIPYLAARWIDKHLGDDNARMLLVDRSNPDALRHFVILGWLECLRPGFAKEVMDERPELILISENSVRNYTVGVLYEKLFKRWNQLPYEERKKRIECRLSNLMVFDIVPILRRELASCNGARLKFAAVVARECNCYSMESLIVDVILCQTVDIETKVDLSYDLVRLTLGKKDDGISRLKRLLGRTIQTRDEENLRSNILRCLCPDFISIEEIIPLLSVPLSKNYFGAYAAFIEYTLPQHLGDMLNVGNAPIVLRWASLHVYEDEPFDRLGQLARYMFTLCWRWIRDQNVRGCLAQCVIENIRYYKTWLPFIDERDVKYGISSGIDKVQFREDVAARILLLNELINQCRGNKENVDLSLLVGSYRDLPLVSESDIDAIARYILDDNENAGFIAQLIGDVAWRLDVTVYGDLLNELHRKYPNVNGFNVDQIKKAQAHGKEINDKWELEDIKRKECARYQRDCFVGWMHRVIKDADVKYLPNLVCHIGQADGTPSIPPVDIRDSEGWRLLDKAEKGGLAKMAKKYLSTIDTNADVGGHIICCIARFVWVDGNEVDLGLDSDHESYLFKMIVENEHYWAGDDMLWRLMTYLYNTVQESSAILTNVLVQDCQKGYLQPLAKFIGLLDADGIEALFARILGKRPADLDFSRILLLFAQHSPVVEKWSKFAFKWSRRIPPDIKDSNTLRVVVQLVPRERMGALVKWIMQDSKWGQGWLENAFRFDEVDGFASCILQCTNWQVAQFLRFLDQHYPDAIGSRHDNEVSYAPDDVDKVFELKEYILRSFVTFPSKRAIAILKRINHLAPSRKWKNLITHVEKELRVAVEAAMEEIKQPISMQEMRMLLLPENKTQMILHTPESLHRYLDGLLSRYNEWLKRGSGHGNGAKLWRRIHAGSSYFWIPKGELYLSDEIGSFIECEGHSLSAFREPFVSFYRKNGKKRRGFADIVVHAQDPKGRRSPAEVIIEIKGNWNREVKTGLKEQLIDHYLKKRKRSEGIFVCGCFNLPSKSTISGYRSENEAQVNLNVQHRRLGLRWRRLTSVKAITCSIVGVKLSKIRKS